MLVQDRTRRHLRSLVPRDDDLADRDGGCRYVHNHRRRCAPGKTQGDRIPAKLRLHPPVRGQYPDVRTKTSGDQKGDHVGLGGHLGEVPLPAGVMVADHSDQGDFAGLRLPDGLPGRKVDGPTCPKV